MLFSKLGEVLKRTTDKIANAIFLDKKLVDSIIKDLQRALIEADVNVKLVKSLTDELKQQALDERIKGIEKKEHIIKLLNDKLLEILGEGAEIILEKGKNKKVMLLGLYGAGKTTTIAKLANYYGKRGFKTCMLGLDVHRPAARDQLEQLASQHKLRVFVDKNESDPLKIYKKFQKELEEYDLVLVDTAGRHSLDKELIKEISDLGKLIKPDYVLLVMPADIGQAARNQASEFQNALNINGVIITRMDSSAKGGGALTACNEVKAKVFFITTGEKINDIELFSAERFISRILGMGDLQSLLEKVNSAIGKDEQERIKKRLEEGKFTMDDLYEQLENVDKVGTFSKIAEMIPGFSSISKKIPENLLGVQEDKMKKFKYAIQSMTPEERENPELIEKSNTRLQRIAKGAGVNTSDVRSLLKQYKLLKDFLNSGDSFDPTKGIAGMSQKQMMKFAKKFGKKIRF